MDLFLFSPYFECDFFIFFLLPMVFLWVCFFEPEHLTAEDAKAEPDLATEYAGVKPGHG